MITPEQKKKLIMMAGILLVVMGIFFAVFLWPKKPVTSGNPPTPPAPPAPAPAAAKPTTVAVAPPTPAGPAPKSTAAPAKPGAKPATPAPAAKPKPTAPAPKVAAKPAPPKPSAKPHLPAGVVATLPGGPKGKPAAPAAPAAPAMPKAKMPDVPAPVAIGALYDPFSGGPKPPPKVVVVHHEPPPPWLRPDEAKKYFEDLILKDKLKKAPIDTGTIRVVQMPTVRSTRGRVRQTVNGGSPPLEVVPPPGRHAGYIYSAQGIVFALIEDATTRTCKALKVKDTINGYTIKAINMDYVILLDPDGHDVKLRLQPLETSPWPDPNAVNVDPQGDIPRNAPPRNAPPRWPTKH